MVAILINVGAKVMDPAMARSIQEGGDEGWKEGGRGGGRRGCTCRQSPSIDSPLIHVFKPLAGRDGQMEPVQSKYMSY